MDLLLHPSSEHGHTRPDRRGRLSTVGHGAALRAFARMARKAGIRFMVIGGTFRDVAVRATSTRDIDVVLVDCEELDAEVMQKAGFGAVAGSPHVWRFRAGDRLVDKELVTLLRQVPRPGAR